MNNNEAWNPRMEFDPITATPDGSTVWHDYAVPRRIIVTKPGELPQDVIARDTDDLCACGCGRLAPVAEKGHPRLIAGHKEREQ